jgi:hypothetical protein
MTTAISSSSRASIRAAQWLSYSWDSSHKDSPVLAHGALALAEICTALNSDNVRLVETVIKDILAEDRLNFAATDLVTALVSAAPIIKADTSPAQSSLHVYLDLLGEIIPLSAQDANGLIARMALEGVAPMEADASAPLMEIDLSLLRSGRVEDTKRVLDRIEVETRFGTRAVRVRTPLPELMEGAGIHALSMYDLPLGMRCLRARCYLDGESPLAIETGADFLRLSQCSDGSFGDFEAAIRKMNRKYRQTEGELHIKLPVTFQSLWTLAEIEDHSFRLFRYVFGTHGLRSAH